MKVHPGFQLGSQLGRKVCGLIRATGGSFFSSMTAASGAPFGKSLGMSGICSPSPPKFDANLQVTGCRQFLRPSSFVPVLLVPHDQRSRRSEEKDVGSAKFSPN